MAVFGGTSVWSGVPYLARCLALAAAIGVAGLGAVSPLFAQAAEGSGPRDGRGGAEVGARSRIVRTGMTVLGSWAVANIAGGVAGATLSEDPTAAGFWEMNALWNTVNLTLAGTTLVAERRRTDPSGTTDLTLPAYRAESHRLEKILLFNAGLDLGYMALGGWMWDRGRRGAGLPNSGVGPERLAGWGQALVLQGGFLFLFDVVLATVVAGDRRRVSGETGPARAR